MHVRLSLHRPRPPRLRDARTGDRAPCHARRRLRLHLLNPWQLGLGLGLGSSGSEERAEQPGEEDAQVDEDGVECVLFYSLSLFSIRAILFTDFSVEK